MCVLCVPLMSNSILSIFNIASAHRVPKQNDRYWARARTCIVDGAPNNSCQTQSINTVCLIDIHNSFSFPFTLKVKVCLSRDIWTELANMVFTTYDISISIHTTRLYIVLLLLFVWWTQVVHTIFSRCSLSLPDVVVVVGFLFRSTVDSE